MTVFVVRAFLKDVHEAAIVTILQRVMDIIDPPKSRAGPDKPRIGFKP
jgi:hypothetical protein